MLDPALCVRIPMWSEKKLLGEEFFFASIRERLSVSFYFRHLIQIIEKAASLLRMSHLNFINLQS